MGFFGVLGHQSGRHDLADYCRFARAGCGAVAPDRDGMCVTALCMLFAGLLFVWGWVTPNPLSIKIRSKLFRAEDPGLLAITRHPFPWAFTFWGFGHLASNGDAGPAILFGILAAFSVVGTLILDVRWRREFGLDAWKAMSTKTSSVPFAAIFAGRAPMPWRAMLSWHSVIALVAYVILLMAHEWVIGVSPFPPF